MANAVYLEENDPVSLLQSLLPKMLSVMDSKLWYHHGTKRGMAKKHGKMGLEQAVATTLVYIYIHAVVQHICTHYLCLLDINHLHSFHRLLLLANGPTKIPNLLIFL